MREPPAPNEATVTMVERRAVRMASRPSMHDADTTPPPVRVDIVPESPLQFGRHEQGRGIPQVRGRSDG